VLSRAAGSSLFKKRKKGRGREGEQENKVLLSFHCERNFVEK